MESKRNEATPQTVGLTAAAGYQIGVRRTLPMSAEEAWAFLISTEGLALWLGDVQPPAFQQGENFGDREGISGQFRVIKENQQLRLKWKLPKWEHDSTLQIRLIPAKTGTTVSFHQENLDNAHTREAMKQHWEDVINKMKEHAN
ncbi:SRPBCC family protein [Paenibacillus sp. MMS18-CY102]|uniref:SRPBCC family protein n=1 Tax=Paenibacillus sp. MMS18-CY102 TaxID=2682849 RepID=UPI0013660BB4|nr:SRPBCC domain-containing protein [Paenibacillus sp. MMS18-CY102]MWC31228.1 SRPBCC domain-containing protein [Paenibacillus sp. MMS18-CY102]